MENNELHLRNVQLTSNRLKLKALNTVDKNIPTYLNNLQQLLDIYGFTSLRPNQEDAIYHLFSGQDLLFVTETSGGKSFCYIAPALCMGLKTIVFFPLVSLIQDQAYQLRLKGCRVGEISSNVSANEVKEALIAWETDNIDFLFVAPERLNNSTFMEIMLRKPPDFVVVDEIHSASEHGDNFRSSYKLIAPFIFETKPKLFLGQTATMSKEVEDDVRNIFDLKDTTKIVRSYKRENLKYTVAPKLFNYDAYILNKLNEEPLVPTIVYCSSIKKVQQLYSMYHDRIKGGVMTYYGEMTPHQKESNQQNFMTSKIRCVFATNAFGMGIDKSDIGRIIFASFPSTIEELTQCFGRGGRNGCECECILCPDEQTLSIQNFFIQTGFPVEYDFKKVYKCILDNRNKTTELTTMTLSDIAYETQCDNRSVGSVVEFFKGLGIVKRQDKVTTTKIRYKNIPMQDDPIYDKFCKYRNKIDFLGDENNDEACIEVDLLFLAEELGLTTATVKKNIKNFCDLGFMSVVNPTRSQPIKILKPYAEFDYSIVKDRREKKLANLQNVIKYSNLSQNELAIFLEKYYEHQAE